VEGRNFEGRTWRKKLKEEIEGRKEWKEGRKEGKEGMKKGRN
jgi:hypothetical protein